MFGPGRGLGEVQCSGPLIWMWFSRFAPLMDAPLHAPQCFGRRKRLFGAESTLGRRKRCLDAKNVFWVPKPCLDTKNLFWAPKDAKNVFWVPKTLIEAYMEI